MFYITMAILGFQIVAGTIIFGSTARHFLPRFPCNMASEIGFFHASSDVAGTANMCSAMRSRHLKRLEGTYGYGKFKGSDGERHVGIERMSSIRGYKKVVVTTSVSSTIPDMTTMVRTAETVTSASPSPHVAGVRSFRGRGHCCAGLGDGSDGNPGSERGRGEYQRGPSYGPGKWERGNRGRRGRRG